MMNTPITSELTLAASIFLNEHQLAARWQISVKKLQADRWNRVGAPYYKFGRSVRYSIADIELFEAQRSVRVS